MNSNKRRRVVVLLVCVIVYCVISFLRLGSDSFESYYKNDEWIVPAFAEQYMVGNWHLLTGIRPKVVTLADMVHALFVVPFALLFGLNFLALKCGFILYAALILCLGFFIAAHYWGERGGFVFAFAYIFFAVTRTTDDVPACSNMLMFINFSFTTSLIALLAVHALFINKNYFVCGFFIGCGILLANSIFFTFALTALFIIYECCAKRQYKELVFYGMGSMFGIVTAFLLRWGGLRTGLHEIDGIPLHRVFQFNGVHFLQSMKDFLTFKMFYLQDHLLAYDYEDIYYEYYLCLPSLGSFIWCILALFAVGAALVEIVRRRASNPFVIYLVAYIIGYICVCSFNHYHQKLEYMAHLLPFCFLVCASVITSLINDFEKKWPRYRPLVERLCLLAVVVILAGKIAYHASFFSMQTIEEHRRNRRNSIDILVEDLVYPADVRAGRYREIERDEPREVAEEIEIEEVPYIHIVKMNVFPPKGPPFIGQVLQTRDYTGAPLYGTIERITAEDVWINYSPGVPINPSDQS